MDWEITYEENDRNWIEETCFKFGKSLENEFSITLQYTSLKSSKPYEVLCGIELEDRGRSISSHFVYDFNLELVRSLPQFNGETKTNWWCASFDLKKMDSALELVQKIKEYFENYYLSVLPETYK